MPRKHRGVYEVGECSRRRDRALVEIMNSEASVSGLSLLSLYLNNGDCCVCEQCGAYFWLGEKVINGSTNLFPKYNRCCKGGAACLSFSLEPPPVIKQLYSECNFMENIRAYNNMFFMTSFGAQIDDAVNDGCGPYVFKVSRKISHWIGLLCPVDDERPRFLQLYIYDTDNEVSNRLWFFHSSNCRCLLEPVVIALMDTLNACNEYVRMFRSAYCNCLRLRSNSVPTEKGMTVNMYYCYQIHGRHNVYSLLLNGGRLYQQYLVDAYTCIEQNRLDYISTNQYIFRSEYISGLYDVVARGDTIAREVGKLVFMPSSFTGGPRYMYKHYLDALAICRVHENPQYFVTFTSNIIWPEITRHLHWIGYT